MVIKETLQERERVRDGVGKAHFYHVIPKDVTDDNVRMFAKIVLDPGASIGWHQHVGETEPYYILEGEGVFTDNDGSQTRVAAGDVCLIENMHFHSIQNASDENPLSFMALIYKKD